LHDGAVVDDEAAVCMAGTERNFDAVRHSLRHVLRDGARARGRRAREERERSQPIPATPLCIDHRSVFLHRISRAERVAGTQHVAGNAVMCWCNIFNLFANGQLRPVRYHSRAPFIFHVCLIEQKVVARRWNLKADHSLRSG
jgi:hypothetical protein